MNINNNLNGTVSVKEKISYALADGFGMLLNLIISSYLMFYFTNVAGISLAVAGSITFIARIWDGINDPIMGIIVDKTKTKYGKARPYLLWFAIPFAIVSVLLFLVPDISQSGKNAYALIMYLIYTTAFTAVYLPYGALGALMSKNQLERSSIQTYRMVAFNITAFSMGFIPLMATTLGKGDLRIGYPLTIGIYGILSAVGFLLAFRNCEERVVSKVETKKVTLKESLKNLYLNRPWIIVAAYQLIHWTKSGILMTAQMYFLIYFLQVGEFEIALYSMIPSIAGLISTTCAQKIETILKGKKNTIIALNLLSLIGTVGMLFVGANFKGALIMNSVTLFFLMPNLVYMYAMIADTVEYGEWKTGVRSEGLIFAGQSFTSKVGPGLGAAIGAFMLTYIGFDPVTPSEASISLIPTYIFGSAIVLTLLQVAVMKFYNLDNKKYESIIKELEERKVSV